MGGRQSIIPVIGLELEFYLLKNGNKISSSNFLLDDFIKEFSKEFDFKIEKEQGEGQIEIKTSPICDLKLISDNLNLIKNSVVKIANNLGLEADFSAQPFEDDCGNALQINLNFVDDEGNNLFVKNSDEESELLLFVVAGILEFSDKIIEKINLKEADLKRHNLELNRNLFKNKKYTAPVNISWGYDNRTCLIRIPRLEGRRLEYRLAPANTDFLSLIKIILKAAEHGIKNKLKAPKPIYGNAFDYNLRNLLHQRSDIEHSD